MSALYESQWLLAEATESSTLSVCFRGDWSGLRTGPLRQWRSFERALPQAQGFTHVVVKTQELGNWDSELPGFVMRLCRWADKYKMTVDLSALPEGAQKILALAQASLAAQDAGDKKKKCSLLFKIGSRTLGCLDSTRDLLAFTGEMVLSLGRLFTGRSRFRWKDVWTIIQKCGVDALPIVSLISFLVGMILAYVGVVQLQQFGATIYVANLVAIAMVREMGAIMTGVIMSGRTGAAFAAELGSMKVSEEISALRTFAIPPYDFLVTPRMMAMVLMMPLLVLYSNLLGILGGGVVAIGMGLTPLQYGTQAIQSLDLGELANSMMKSVVFGAIVGFTGCLRGMQSGNSAEAVGRATTSAVVTAITWIIVADAIFAVLFNIFGL